MFTSLSVSAGVQEFWQKVVVFFTVTVKDFFVNLLQNKPVAFYLIIAGAALLLAGIIALIVVGAKKSKAKKAAKKAKKARAEKAKAQKKPAVAPAGVSAPAPAPVAQPASAAVPAAAPVSRFDDEKTFSDETFAEEEYAALAPVAEEPTQVDMTAYEAPEAIPDEVPETVEPAEESEPAEEITPVVPAPAEEEKTYIEPSNNEPFEDDSWGKAKINVKPKKAAREEQKPAEEAAPVAEEAPVESKPTKKASPKKQTTEKTAEAPAKKAPAKTAKKKAEPAPAPVAEEEEETEKPKVVGKYIIEDTGYAFQFRLYANNGQLLYESREYASYNSCKGGIETFKKNILAGEHRVDVDKNGGYKYIFKKGNSIYIGETYSTAKAAERSAESVIRFAPVSELQEG
ncbi:MAG: YegP family protein [Christensenellaceae bacterium]|nr:YegP family protein [Christensenellaceae bacterium]